MRCLLPKNTFARGVGVLVGGTTGAQILSMFVAPLLTRLYSPDDFGVVAVYGSLVGLVGVIATLRYEHAIPLPEEDTEAAHVLVLSLLVVLLMSLLAACAAVIAGDAVVLALQVPLLGDYLWMVPVGVLLGGGYSVFNYWAIRTKRFSTIATTRIRQSLVAILIQLTACKLGAVALLLAGLASQSVGTTTLAKHALTNSAMRSVSWLGIRQAASRYRRFPLFSTWEGLFNTAGLQLPPLMFAALFSPAAAGLYALANRVLSLPMALIGGAIGQVFYASAAEAHRQGRIGTLVADLHAKLAHIGLPPALVLVLIGPELFAFVFGPDWRQAGEFARWMAPWLYLVFVSSPLSTLFFVLEQQVQGLTFQIILLLARVGAIFLGAWWGDLTLTIMLFAGTSTLVWVGFLFWVAHLAGNPPKSMILPTLAAMGIALLCAMPLIVERFLDLSDPLAWLPALALSGLLILGRYWVLLRKVY